MSSAKKRRELHRAQQVAELASSQLGTDKTVAAIWKAGAEKLQAERDRLAAENKELREALAWIATQPASGQIQCRATAALAKGEGE